jgi:CheY-like chemotaxis protein
MDQNIGEAGYILIVNNDPAMRQAVSSYFSDHNYPTSCLSAWSELKCTGTFASLIIMDQPLGLHDGLDRLRSIRSKSDIPIFMNSRRIQQMLACKGSLRCFQERHQQGILALGQRDWCFIGVYESSAITLKPPAVEPITASFPLTNLRRARW